VPKRDLNKNHLTQFEDWQGNNIALACPVCLKVFVVSGLIHKKGRACPNCGKAKAFVTADGEKASIECNEGGIPVWKSN
jgi:hypothetical protein